MAKEIQAKGALDATAEIRKAVRRFKRRLHIAGGTKETITLKASRQSIRDFNNSVAKVTRICGEAAAILALESVLCGVPEKTGDADSSHAWKDWDASQLRSMVGRSERGGPRMD